MASGVVQVRRPKAICLDILGTASKSGFLERILFPFLKLNLDNYLTKHWDQMDFKRLFKRIQDNSVELNRTEPSTPIVLAHNTSQAKSSLLNFLNFCTENGVQSPPVTHLRFKVWFEGYQSSKLLTPIYSDVPVNLRRWKMEGIKFYVFSNTWVEAQKALLRNTTHGDLTPLITAHFDNDFGMLTESDSWRRFCVEVHHRPEDTLFLTKSVQEGRAAQDAGLQVVLVLTHRHNVKAVGAEDRQRFPYVRTLNDLHWLDDNSAPDQTSSAATTSAVQAGAPTLAPASNTTQATSQAAGSQPALASQARSSPSSGASPASATGAGRSSSRSSRKG